MVVKLGYLKSTKKMNKTVTEKKIERIANQNPISGWKSKVEFRRNNKDWLQKSATIAVHIFERLKELGKTQKELAADMSVSPQRVNKILKGDENLTIGTISILENVLGIELLEVLKSNTKSIEVSLDFKYSFCVSETFDAHEFSVSNFDEKVNITRFYASELPVENQKTPVMTSSKLAKNSYEEVFDKNIYEEGDFYSNAA